MPTHPLSDGTPPISGLWPLYARYGASLRSTFAFATYPGLYEDSVSGRLKKLPSQKLDNLLQGVAGNFCLLIATGPLLDDRTKPEGKMASQFSSRRHANKPSKTSSVR